MIIGSQIRVRGLVQGVGFRPTVWRLAHHHQLSGDVLNDGEGVLVKVWGTRSQIDAFVIDLKDQCPPLARIDSIIQSVLNGDPATEFNIVKSKHSKTQTGIVADAATCPACVEDCFNPDNRRYRYPFTNCTHCGPRLTIIDGIPYDRVKTSMAGFTLCPECLKEYQDPADRRFHAQPNACPGCGPKVWLEPNPDISHASDVIDAAAELIQQGKILAIKGLGGFHLACDATNSATVNLLRERKRRYAKPFALMARDLNVIRKYCKINNQEIKLIQSKEAPIVLLQIKNELQISQDVAPKLNIIGFMLPYTPLHHLLMQDLDFPIVMTSGNISDVPQCIDNNDAITKLLTIADHLLLNDREIKNRVDDSVARVTNNKSRLLRRARGYAPATLTLPQGFEGNIEVLAFGAELKNTFCMIKNGQAILSQHMGDLENTETFIDYKKNLQLYQLLFDHKPQILAVDKHPDYLSTKSGKELAINTGLPLTEVQHHHAHIAACLAENNWPLNGGKVLGVVLDGLGLSNECNIWGGEFLLADYIGFERLGSLVPVALAGGSQAMREPWRNTLTHLLRIMKWDELVNNYANLDLVSFLKQKSVKNILQMLNKGLNSPLASSSGRLFDAVAAAVGICQERQLFEGQAAMELESLVTESLILEQLDSAYSFEITQTLDNNLPRLEPQEMWLGLLDDLQKKTPKAVIATRFHLGLAKGIVSMVNLICKKTTVNINGIVLSGGVFQNQILLLQVSNDLRAQNYNVLEHSAIPANDGGIALGQATIALAKLIRKNV